MRCDAPGYAAAMSEDRYTYPAEGETSEDRDRDFTDVEEQARLAEHRSVVNAEEPEGAQGTSADAQGHNPAARESL